MVSQILRRKEVLRKTGLSNTTLYARIASGSFPKGIPLGSPNIVGWLDTDVDQWIADRVREARGEPVAA